MKSKAQASLEYLMTYGWALIIIATVVAVLVFVVTPSTSAISFASDSTKITVKGGAVAAGGGNDSVSIVLQNVTGGAIEVTGISSTGNLYVDRENVVTLNGQSLPVDVVAGGELRFENIDTGVGNSVNGGIVIDYTDVFNLSRSVSIGSAGGAGDAGAAAVCGDGICESREACSSDCANETYCLDSVDNDKDGATDCADTADCSSDPACIPFQDDMESGTGGWSAGGMWHLMDDSGACPNSNSPTHARYYGQDSSCNYDNGSTNFGRLASPSIDLTGAGSATLYYSYWIDNECGENCCGYDDLTVEINVGGGGWQDLVMPCGSAGTWHDESISLSPYVGNNVQIGFYFDTLDDWGNEYTGVYIDDVSVVKTG